MLAAVLGSSNAVPTKRNSIIHGSRASRPADVSSVQSESGDVHCGGYHAIDMCVFRIQSTARTAVTTALSPRSPATQSPTATTTDSTAAITATGMAA